MAPRMISSSSPSTAAAPTPPPFLGNDGENKVGLLLRQKIQVRLRPLHEPAAPHAAGAERDFRLNNVIPSAQRIAFRIP